jgi:predicted TPR repeat methyltransferase
VTAAVNHSSGDLNADRRYGYAQDLLQERDFAAAADLFQQVLELAPDWAPAWFRLGEALESAGDSDSAIAAFRRSLELAPGDALGAKVRLARLGGIDASDSMTPGYVAALFDQYADRFDNHLTAALKYRGPDIIMQALHALHGSSKRRFFFDAVMDLGCGTGLMAEAIRSHIGVIDGVDLSPAMVALAHKRSVYRELIVGDVTEALGGREYTLLLAADVLVYIGDLGPLFRAAAKALPPLGLFAFTVQAHDGKGFRLGPDLRFHHSLAYLAEAAHASGFNVRHAVTCVTREDAGEPVNGFVVVLERAGV